MSKNYQHKPIHNGDPLLRIENKALRTKLHNLNRDHERLQVALRMLTSADKQDLLDAVDRLQNSNTWYNQPSYTIDPMTAPIITTGTFTTNNTAGSNTQYIIADDVGVK